MRKPVKPSSNPTVIRINPKRVRLPPMSAASFKRLGGYVQTAADGTLEYLLPGGYVTTMKPTEEAKEAK